MDLKLKSVSVVVTGSSRGLGRDIALAFADEGANVAICGRDKNRLEAVAGEVRQRGVKCVSVVADLTDAGACQRVIDSAVAEFGRLDVLVNNASAGVSVPPTFMELTDDQLLQRIVGKTLPAIRCSRAAIPALRRSSAGRIVFIGGTAAKTTMRADERPGPSSTIPQGLGNAAVSNLSKQLADELGRDGILVNIVVPHIINTPRHAERVAKTAKEQGVDLADLQDRANAHIPIGRILETSDIVPLVLFLSSSVNSAVTGQAITVDGGAMRAISY